MSEKESTDFKNADPELGENLILNNEVPRKMNLIETLHDNICISKIHVEHF